MESENQRLKAENQEKDEKIANVTKQFENSQNNEKDLKRQLDDATQEVNNLKKQKNLKVFENETLNMVANPEMDLSKYGSFPNLKKLAIRLDQLPGILQNKPDLSKVTHLNIYKTNKLFSAAELPDLFHLTQNVENLDLYNCHLTSLPKEIGNLKNLNSLNFGYNDLTYIPKEISGLTELEYLYLRGNLLSELPKEIGNLKNLRKLKVSFNNLTSLPKEIGNLKNLRGLNLGFNNLTSIPKEIGNLKKLKYLYLRENKLTELPAEIYTLSDLKELDIRNNPLKKLSREMFVFSDVKIDQ